MALTANEIIRIMKIARYKACRERMGFKNEPWEKYLKSIEDEIKDTEQEDGNE